MKKILLTLLGVLLALPGIARDFTYEYEGQTLTYTVIDEEAKTCRTKEGESFWGGAGNRVSGALVIPPVAKDGDVEYSVTSIGSYAFSDCSGLTSVIIPNSVTAIGYYAFSDCSGLTSVIIPNSVNSIVDYAFSGCTGLTSVIIPNSVTSIGSYAFRGCSGLTSVIIPDSVTAIGYYAFSECTGLTSVIIGNSVTSIGEAAFHSCSGLTSVIIGNSVATIGETAFRDCSSLTSVIIPNSVATIGRFAFGGCSGLTSVIIGNSVNSIGDYVFSGCSGLEKSAYPSGLSNPFYSYGIAIEYPREGAIIEDGFVFGPEKNAIYFAPLSLEGEYVIPNTVTSIDSYAFYECTGLTSVTIPDCVSSIGGNAFSRCSVLKTLTVEDGKSSIAFESAVFDGAPIEHLYIGRNWSYSKDYNAISTSIKSVEIGNSVTELPSYAFRGCSGLTSAIISNSVNSIGLYAFDGCSGLTSVIIPNSVTSIGCGSFSDCSGLTSVIIGNSVNSIGDYVFSGCSGLKKSAYPSGLYNPFRYGTVIQYPSEGAIIEDGFVYGPEKSAIYFAPLSFEGEFDIPESVTSIGENAFYGCSGLTSVKTTTINPPVMNDNSFEGLYDTAALSVPEDAVTGYLATNWSLFENLRIGDSETAAQTYETGNLKYMLIPGKTQEDKNLAVVIPGDYSSLTQVTIPERFTVPVDGKNVRYYVDGIGFNAFKGCSDLATVTFNSRNASTVIGDYAFAGTKISELTIPETVKAIGNHAFDGCKSLTSIVIPGSVKAIGDYAFYHVPLNKITLNEGLETIGEYCFYASQYTKIKPIYIPSTLTWVGADAFTSHACEYVNISDLTAWCNIDFGNYESNPASDSYLCLNGERIEDLVIPESVNAIKDYAFYENGALKSVKFPDTLQRIGRGAFRECGGLTTVVIPGNVTYIGHYAFHHYEDLTRLKNITFAYGAEQIEIDKDAFPAPTTLSWDRPLESLTLDVSSLESLTIGNSVKEIPAAKFKGASKLTSLTLGNGLTAIGDEAFSGCNALTEVILPPSVETIGASVFDGNSKLTSIIMGHKVTTIGEKAYNLCPAQTVSITAQTPPTAPDNTFSNYTGSLYVQGQQAADAYYDADYCWYQFEGQVMIEPTEFKVEGDKTLNGKPGDTFQLKATLYPTDVTLPQVFWRSTNPDIATVDANGLVTLHADLSEVMTMAEGDDDATARSCKIVAESLYADGPVAEFTVEDVNSSVISAGNDSNDGAIDYSAPYEVYSINGMKVADTTDDLAPGIYIIRQGKNVEKVALH